MSRLFAVLTLSFFLVGCEALWEDDASDLPAPEATPAAVSMPAADATPAPVAAPVVESEKAAGPKFSWEAPAAAPVAVIAPAVEAPKDSSKARITEIRESLGLVAFVRSEAPALKSLLQLIKEGKVLVVEVVSVKGTQVVANILPGQKNGAQLSESDIVGVAPQGAIGGQ